MKPLLHDLLVVELASVLAGPDVGMFFAEMGAKVIKIENKKTQGDVTRKWKTPSEKENAAGVTAYFSSVNWNKTHLLYDLSDKNDYHAVTEWISKADVLIVNFKPGDDKKFRLDYVSLQKKYPHLIYGAINGYGSESAKVAYDVVLQAETGFMSINGTPESGPLKMPVALIDVLAAHQLKEGLLLALLNRFKTGKGAFVEVSLFDAALASLKNQATNWLMNGENSKLQGSLHPNIAPYGETFQTKDQQWIVLAVGTDQQFVKLLEVLDNYQLINDERFATNVQRVKNRQVLHELLVPAFREKTAQEINEQFSQYHIPFGNINDIKTVFQEPAAQQLILEENINGIPTKRVKTAVFKFTKS